MSYNRQEVLDWISDDPDVNDARYLKELLTLAEDGDTGAAAELSNRFSGMLTFGTAGLRGELGAGPNRMNRAVVIRAAAGLSAFLAEQLPDGFTVVIGHDARHGSRQFALDTAAVVEGAGGHAKLFDHALPTPLTAFALRKLGADAGVVVTASHNPPADNGYKVYLGGNVVKDSGQGAQIVTPYDGAILEKIMAVPSVASVPRAESGWEELGDEIVASYIDRLAQIVPEGPRDLKIVHTSMHGVGGEIALRAFAATGFDDVTVVPEQHEPNPDFPTVSFPNPEEPGALDLAMALAKKLNADLILANDPDADRSSAAIPDPASPSGWRQLTGDEIGSLLGAQAAEELAEGMDRQGTGPSDPPAFANSIVSSRLLGKIAAASGIAHRNTLTGFKWISRVPGLVYGYEEAIGFCVDPLYVRDKDGITASTKLAALAADLKEQGLSLQNKLDELAISFGLHATAPLTIRVEDLSLIAHGMENLRKAAPQEIAGSPVVESADLADGFEGLPPTDGLLYKTADDDRVIVRPSGTEPKLKCYIEVIVPVKDEDVAAARALAASRLETIRTDMRAAVGI